MHSRRPSGSATKFYEGGVNTRNKGTAAKNRKSDVLNCTVPPNLRVESSLLIKAVCLVINSLTSGTLQAQKNPIPP